ncbi:MAG: hypothetical protein II945_06160 [Bacteroidales bacterium]|nr:hypothetical protein [Bacteroidales bacterium]
MKKIFLMSSIVSILIMFTACNNSDNDDIVGKWKWKSTEGVSTYMGEVTTSSIEYPIYKDLTFYKNGKVKVLQQGIHIPEDEPPYFNYQYNYSINTTGDSICLTDPKDDYYPQIWVIKSLTKRHLTVEYRIDSAIPEDQGTVYTTTYRRK